MQDSLSRFSFSIEIDMISSNDSYWARPYKVKGSSNKWSARMIPSVKLKNYKVLCKEKFSEVEGLKEFISTSISDVVKKGETGIELSLDYYLDYTRYYSIDISNTIKPFEDCLKEYIGVDDVHNSSVKWSKILSSSDNMNTAVVSIVVVNLI